jgi:hypothetical protein
MITTPCIAHDVILIDIASRPSVERLQVQLAVNFYGLNCDIILTGPGHQSPDIIDALIHNNSRPVIITASALLFLNTKINESTAFITGKKNAPILIIGIDPKIDENTLALWSNGALKACRSHDTDRIDAYYKISSLPAIARELAGQSLNVPLAKINYLKLDENHRSESVMGFIEKNSPVMRPVFIKLKRNTRELFFLAKSDGRAAQPESAWKFSKKKFYEMAPILMFLRYACKESCWHTDYDYANLTIDDPWLTQSYGHLSFHGLLEEMRKSRFHTTIAFIPWNFDRNKASVITLFKEYPAYFSICIHGNNHDHEEFKPDNNSKPQARLEEHESDIRQALARMDKFRELTGIPYDRVFVFPHHLGSANTLKILKKYDFLSTVNAGNIPSDAPHPVPPEFNLRSIYLGVDNFPSLNRYSPLERSYSNIAIDLFLDNPVLLFSHHGYFRNKITSFNATAKFINHQQPDTVWQSLGYISRRLYLKKLREDGSYEVLAFSSDFILENNSDYSCNYFVRKLEVSDVPIKKITVDGGDHPYFASHNEINLAISMPPGDRRRVKIVYEDRSDLKSVEISKTNLRINIIRHLSDFRDIRLSNNFLGRMIVQFYYRSKLYKLGLAALAILLCAGTMILLIFFRYSKKRKAKHRLISAPKTSQVPE